MKTDYIALVDSHGGGMMLGLEVKKGEDPMTAMLRMVEAIKVQSLGMADSITFVEPCPTKPESAYIHPPMKNHVASDGSVNTPKGKQWFKLIFSFDLKGEEE
jgi:hypothetical protein